MRVNCRLCLAVATCLFLPPWLLALINPDVTIVNLVNDSTTVLFLELDPVADGRITAKVTDTIKGKAAARELTFVVSEDEKAQQAAQWLKSVGKGQPAVLFTGVNPDDPEALYVEIGCTWVKCTRDPDGTWYMENDDKDLETVWGGSARTLVLAVRYVNEDRHPDFPVMEEVNWTDERQLGKLAGPAHGLRVVDLGGDGGRCVVVLSAGGDRAYRVGGAEAGADITEQIGLASKSRHLAAADFTGDGRTDLVSWDGKALAVLIHGEDGRFAAPVAGPALVTVNSLATLRLADGRPGLVVGLADGIELLVIDKGGVIEAVPPPPLPPNLTLDAPCSAMVADIDGDGRTDLVRLATDGLVCRAGITGPPTTSTIPLPANVRSAIFGDYDGDGRLDLFVLGGKQFAVLCRDAQGGWLRVTPETGELLECQPRNDDAAGLVAAAPLDLNGDGRQGVAVFNAKAPPSMFFNRGFACFGLSRKMDQVYTDEPGFECMGAGVQVGTVVDLDDDGFPDVCVVDPAGAVWVVRTEGERPRRFRLTLSPPADAVGPLTVTVRQGDRPLGMYVVRPAEPMTLGLPRAGPVDLRWTAADSQSIERRVVITRPTTAVLAPKE